MRLFLTDKYHGMGENHRLFLERNRNVAQSKEFNIDATVSIDELHSQIADFMYQSRLIPVVLYLHSRESAVSAPTYITPSSEAVSSILSENDKISVMKGFGGDRRIFDRDADTYNAMTYTDKRGNQHSNQLPAIRSGSVLMGGGKKRKSRRTKRKGSKRRGSKRRGSKHKSRMSRKTRRR